MPESPEFAGSRRVARALLFRVGPKQNTHDPEESTMIRPSSIRVAALAVALTAAALVAAPRHAWAQG
jgi:hypothetical protein